MKRHGVRNLLILQTLIAVIAAVVLYFVRADAPYPALATLYGGAMAVVNTLLLARRTRRANAMNGSPQGQTFGLMVGMVERLAVTLIAFGLGMGWLGLDPLSLLIGFGAAQLAYAGGGASLREVGTAGVSQAKR